MTEPVSVQPDWCRHLPIQQQSVLLLATRGPDGMRKHHPAKHLIRAYRTLTLHAAVLGRTLTALDQGDSFMTAEHLDSPDKFDWAMSEYFGAVDEIPHHYHLHLMHGAEIIGYKHPDHYLRSLWLGFYLLACDDMHLTPETELEMDDRLNDFGRAPGGSQLESRRRAALTKKQVLHP